MHNRSLIERYFAAMRQGPEAEADMLSLFTNDAVYSEPFSGEDAPAIGIDAIRERFRVGWSTPLPDMELEVLSIDVEPGSAVSTWECRSPVFAAPVRGKDRYVLRRNRIAELHVTIESATTTGD